MAQLRVKQTETNDSAKNNIGLASTKTSDRQKTDKLNLNFCYTIKEKTLKLLVSKHT